MGAGIDGNRHVTRRGRKEREVKIYARKDLVACLHPSSTQFFFYIPFRFLSTCHGREFYFLGVWILFMIMRSPDSGKCCTSHHLHFGSRVPPHASFFPWVWVPHPFGLGFGPMFLFISCLLSPLKIHHQFHRCKICM